MRKEIEKRIAILGEKIKKTNSENFKNYLYGQLDAYCEILHMLLEMEKNMIDPNKAIEVLDKWFSKTVEIAEYDDDGRMIGITTSMYEILDDFDIIEYALQDYKKIKEKQND